MVTGTQVGKPPIVTLPTPPALPNLCSSVGCIPQSTVNQIVVTGYRHHRLGGVFLNFNLLYPQEQLFVIYPDGTVIFVPTAAKNVNGEAQNKGHAPLGYVATAHTHTIDISGPGSEDFGQSLPVYFMTPNDGVFLISPGSHRAVYIGG